MQHSASSVANTEYISVSFSDSQITHIELPTDGLNDNSNG